MPAARIRLSNPLLDSATFSQKRDRSSLRRAAKQQCICSAVHSTYLAAIGLLIGATRILFTSATRSIVSPRYPTARSSSIAAPGTAS